MLTIKALSLWQPWASLLSIGAKKIETRSWPTSYRGLIAIHAAKKWDADLADTCYIPAFQKALSATPEWQKEVNRIPWGGPGSLPRGCFIAIGKLRHCLSTSHDAKFIPPKTADEYHFGDYSENRFMWVFDEIWKLREPIYTRGYQQLWTPDEDTKDAIFAMLPEKAVELAEA